MNEEKKELLNFIKENTVLYSKEVLTSYEAAQYMGISKSYLYKLTMKQQIPHYKPMGKMVYFNRQELESWLQGNRIFPQSQLSEKAQAFCRQKGGVI